MTHYENVELQVLLILSQKLMPYKAAFDLIKKEYNGDFEQDYKAINKVLRNTLPNIYIAKGILKELKRKPVSQALIISKYNDVSQKEINKLVLLNFIERVYVEESIFLKKKKL